MLEPLEVRRLLSAAVQDRVLLVMGTDAADVIVLKRLRNYPFPSGAADGVAVAINNQLIDIFRARSFDYADVQGLGGADLIVCTGNTRRVLVQGAGGNDTVAGGNSDDTLLGGSGHDYLVGRDGRDELVGGAGDDQLQGYNGNDSLWGISGNDTLIGGEHADLLSGGAGNDTVTYAGSPLQIFVSADGLGADDGYYIPAPSSPNAGSELREGDNVQADVETIIGGGKRDSLVGSDGANLLIGGDDADTLLGGGGDDTLEGEDGNDSLDGQLGADLFLGGGGSDTATYAGRGQKLVIRLDGAPGDGGLTENDWIMADVENATGGSGNDRIFGSGEANQLSGGGGNDTIDGAGGDDYLSGDQPSGAPGADLLIGGPGNDFLNGEGAADVLEGGPGDDSLAGHTLTNQNGWDYARADSNDTLRGGDGNDLFIDDHAGDIDLIDGGAGQDSAMHNPEDQLLAIESILTNPYRPK